MVVFEVGPRPQQNFIYENKVSSLFLYCNLTDLLGRILSREKGSNSLETTVRFRQGLPPAYASLKEFPVVRTLDSSTYGPWELQMLMQLSLIIDLLRDAMLCSFNKGYQKSEDHGAKDRV
jgi:hypothetical protein